MEISEASSLSNTMFFNQEAYQKTLEMLSKRSFSKIFILVDSNTAEKCLPYFMQQLKTDISIEVVEMEAGEKNKTLDTCTQIWKVLSELGADRKSLLINLGGGVVTDLGGFVASSYQRGIAFINFPTSLLAMVDASVGGKTGVNLENLKNQIGIIQAAEMVGFDMHFLQSLSAREMRSGLAEMLKHGLIADVDYWKKLRALGQMDLSHLQELILRSLEIKDYIVTQDPREENLRKTLNFGHTLGHAIESYFLDHPEKEKLLHGEAVAAGMILAGYLSKECLAFPKEELAEVSSFLFSMYGKLQFSPADETGILRLLKHDKKNVAGKINFVLLKKIGEAQIDWRVPQEVLKKAFEYYAEFQTIN